MSLPNAPRETAQAPKPLELAAAILYEHRLDNLGAQFADSGFSALIVKGQAIVDLSYPSQKVRLAADVDILVGDDESRVSATLERLGYRECRPRGRRYTYRLLGERPFAGSDTQLPGYVELHRFLDKAILRPVDYRGIRDRAQPSGRPGLSYPTVEDLILLLALHESVAIVPSFSRTQNDIERLVSAANPNMEVVWERARAWQLKKALSEVLSGQGASEQDRPSRPGLPYLLKQLARHDDVLTWSRGVLWYALLRTLDRLG